MLWSSHVSVVKYTHSDFLTCHPCRFTSICCSMWERLVSHCTFFWVMVLWRFNQPETNLWAYKIRFIDPWRGRLASFLRPWLVLTASEEGEESRDQFLVDCFVWSRTRRSKRLIWDWVLCAFRSQGPLSNWKSPIIHLYSGNKTQQSRSEDSVVEEPIFPQHGVLFGILQLLQDLEGNIVSC